jgi:organic hydroperoxide reductase OsmC/OhrA
MGDLLIVAVVAACFLGAAAFVRACAWIVTPDDGAPDPEPGTLDEGGR